MEICEYDENYGYEWEHSFKSESSKWCGFDHIIMDSNGEQRCFYCSSNLECGQQECIWRGDSA